MYFLPETGRQSLAARRVPEMLPAMLLFHRATSRASESILFQSAPVIKYRRAGPRARHGGAA
jgi:hypothetical protein